MGGTGCCDGGGYPPGGGAAPLLGPLGGRGGGPPGAADVGGVALGACPGAPPVVPTAGDIEREEEDPVGDGEGLK